MPTKEINVSSKKKKKSSEAVKKLDRSKLHKASGSKSSGDEGSLRAIIILIVVIVILAFGGAFVIRNLQNRFSEEEEAQTESANVENIEETNMDDTAVEEVPLVDQIVVKDVLSDEMAQNKAEDSEYLEDDTVIENSQESSYKLESILAQPFSSFYRVIFKFETDDSEAEIQVPNTEVEYRTVIPEVELTFKNTVEDMTEILTGQNLPVENSVLASIVKNAKSSDEQLVYQLKFNDSTKYFIQYIDDEIILDVMELEPIEIDALDEGVEEAAEDLEEEVDDELEEEASVTETEEAEVNEDMEEQEEVEISSASKSISSDVEGNVAGIKGFSYDDTVEKFIFELKLSNDKVPNVTSNIDEDGTVTVKIKNLALDAIAKEPEYNYVDFASQGVMDVIQMNASHSDGESTYVFKVDEKMDYQINLDESTSEKKLLVEFVH